MNKTELQAMSDRELDAWIAEHVMGARVATCDGETVASFFDSNGVYLRHLGNIQTRPWSGSVTRFNPTTDANDILKVLQQVEKWGLFVDIRMCAYVTIDAPDDPDDPDCYTTHGVGYAEFRAISRLPRAVCEAAAQAAEYRREHEH